MVSLSIASIAPAATATVAAITSGERFLKIAYPQKDAIAEMIVMPAQMPKIYLTERPDFFMPVVLDSDSGMLDKKIAIMAAVLTAPPCIILTPIAMDSGIPSSKEPNAIANPLPPSSDSEGCLPPDRLRCFAPFLLKK